MKAKSLASKNRYLKSADTRKMRARSLASSTAIETGKSIASIEAKIIGKRFQRHVTLA